MPLGSTRGIRPAVVAVLIAAAVTGCVPDAEQRPTTTPTPSATPAPSVTASPTPTPTPTSVPFAIDCDTLVPPSALTGMFAGFARIGTYLPPAGSPGDRVLEAGGTVCGWQNPQHQTLMVAVAQLDAAALLALKNDLVITSHSVPTYGVEGYFQSVGGVGEAQAFLDPYWIVSTSVSYVEPGEPQPIMEAALRALQ